MSVQEEPVAYTTALRALQRRAEALTHGDMGAIGQPVSDISAIEDLRRAIDVLGAHTEHANCVSLIS
jgi:hypothetical protein